MLQHTGVDPIYNMMENFITYKNITLLFQLYRVSGRTVLCYPLTFSATDFYLGHDLALLTANIKSDLRFVSQRWNQEGEYGTVATTNRTRSSVTNEISRPTYCIVRVCLISNFL